MHRITSRTQPVITCDGTGVVSHAGTVLLAELADRIGLTAALSEATDSLRERRAGHHPGRVLVDVAVAIADGAVTISDVQALADPQGLHGPAGSVASTSTIWRVLDAVANTPGVLAKIRQARADARDRAWLARGELAGTEMPGSRAAGKTIAQVVIDLDATLVTAHSDKEGARGNFKGGFGYHPLGAWLDNTNEALELLDAGADDDDDSRQLVDPPHRGGGQFRISLSDLVLGQHSDGRASGDRDDDEHEDSPERRRPPSGWRTACAGWNYGFLRPCLLMWRSWARRSARLLGTGSSSFTAHTRGVESGESTDRRLLLAAPGGTGPRCPCLYGQIRHRHGLLPKRGSPVAQHMDLPADTSGDPGVHQRGDEHPLLSGLRTQATRV